MTTFRLLGHHISYSASPLIHQVALGLLGLDYRYLIEDVSPQELPAAVERLRAGGGANVTQPHKERAAALVDELTAEARALGAVNTIESRAGRLIGHNTDLPAFAEEIRALLRGRAPARAVVLGTGGASRAVQHALRAAGATVVVSSRRDGTAARLPELLAGADLLVNATPVGTAPIPAGNAHPSAWASPDPVDTTLLDLPTGWRAELPLDPALLRTDLAVFDLIYRPTPTALVRAARQVGAPARAGAGMLVGQAWRSLAIWLRGVNVTVDERLAAPMLETLLAELGARDV